MSQQYISALIIVLTSILSLLNIKFDMNVLTQTITAVVTLAGGAYVLYRRYKQGDITFVGTKRK